MSCKPELQVLSDSDCQRVLETALTILRDKGVRFTQSPALDIFRQAGLSVRDDVVFFSQASVERAISSAPTSFVRKGATPERDIVIGDGGNHFAVGSLPIWVVDATTRTRRAAVYDDMLKFILLSERLDAFAIANSVVQPADIPPEVMGAVWNRCESLYTTKPACCWYATSRGMALDTIEILAAAAGGKDQLRASKRWAVTICPDSMLQWGKSIWGVLECAKLNIPCEFLPMPFLGSTHPVTLAGALALSTAETLAGIVLCQLVSPGCPVTFSPSYGGIMDMSTASHAFGTPESALFAAAAARFAKWLHVPSNLMMGASDSKLPDAQAAIEKVQALLLPALAGADCITMAGGLLDFALSASYEQLVIDAEIAAQVTRIRRGVTVDDNALALDTILQVPHGGHFLDTRHTLDNFRQELWFTRLHDRRNYENWLNDGASDMTERASNRVKEVLGDGVPTVVGTPHAEEVDSVTREIFRREGFSGELADRILSG